MNRPLAPILAVATKESLGEKSTLAIQLAPPGKSAVAAKVALVQKPTLFVDATV
jgi:hypothetical protein